MSRSQLARPGLDPAVAASVRGLGGDDTGCTVLHVDLDAFYASAALLTRPELRGRPVLVGGSGARGVVLSATYEARAAGVHSAMPMSRARRLCPDAVVLPPDGEQYARLSAAVMDVLADHTPTVEPLGLDEAFCDVTGAARLIGPPAVVAASIRQQVTERTGLVASVGVASTKSVAKLASARCKPDGLIVVPVAEVVAFLHPLGVGALWGVGERTEAHLVSLGLRTIGDVARTPPTTLRRVLGDVAGQHLHDLAWGRDPRAVSGGGERERSTGAQETFARDLDDPGDVRAELLRLAERTASRLRRSGLAGRTVVLTVRSADFTTVTRSRTLPEATDSTREVHAAAAGLWDAFARDRPRVRMVGVRVEGLTDAARVPRQLRLDDRERGWAEAERAVDAATARFGRGAVTSAVLLRRPDRPDRPATSGPPGWSR